MTILKDGRELQRKEIIKNIANLEEAFNEPIEDMYSNALSENSNGIMEPAKTKVIKEFKAATHELKNNLSKEGMNPQAAMLKFHNKCQRSLLQCTNATPSFKTGMKDFIRRMVNIIREKPLELRKDIHKNSMPQLHQTMSDIKEVYDNLKKLPSLNTDIKPPSTLNR
jgi:hypothetical protein